MNNDLTNIIKEINEQEQIIKKVYEDYSLNKCDKNRLEMKKKILFQKYLDLEKIIDKELNSNK